MTVGTKRTLARSSNARAAIPLRQATAQLAVGDQPSNRVLSMHAAQNAATRDCWDVMAPHRERVMDEILRGHPSGRICVFGAGNSNDLDLSRLVERFVEVHLVDLDAESLGDGVRRQGLGGHSRIRLHGGVDFAGLTGSIPLGTASPYDLASTFRARVEALGEGAIPGDCDIVVSTCVLSQLVQSLAALLGQQATGLSQLALAVRDHHLGRLVSSTKAGGTAILIADMVSSDTAHDLMSCSNGGLAALRERLIRERNFFHGTNPYAIAERLLASGLRSIQRVELRPPWRWSLGPRMFLVNALRIERSGARP